MSPKPKQVWVTADHIVVLANDGQFYRRDLRDNAGSWIKLPPLGNYSVRIPLPGAE